MLLELSPVPKIRIEGAATRAALQYYRVTEKCTCDPYYAQLQGIIETEFTNLLKKIGVPVADDSGKVS